MGISHSARAPRSGNRQQVRRKNRRVDRRGHTRLALVDAAERRGVMVWAHCDLNAPSERGAGTDGADHHDVKYRPVVAWGEADTPNGTGWTVVPVSTSANNSVALRDGATDMHGEPVAGWVIPRLVTLHPDAVDTSKGIIGRLSDRDVALIADAVASGDIADLTAFTGDRLVRGVEGVQRARGILSADDALAELRARRDAIIAAHESA